MGKRKLVNFRERAEADVAGWNSRYSIGQLVDVRLDGGEIRRTRTTSEAHILYDYPSQAVIWVDGIACFYSLARVAAVDEPFNESNP